MNDDETQTTSNRKGPVQKGEVRLLDHSYDGIQEYDQRLPNWWLFTLYGAVVFSFVYYFFSIQSHVGPGDYANVQNELNRLQEIQLAGGFDATDDDVFWDMMANAEVVAKGAVIYEQKCVTCHLDDMMGVESSKPGGIGFNLVDAEWVHGARPSEMYVTIFEGIPDKGMQAWGPVLGPQQVGQVTAFLMSRNDEAELRAAIQAQGEAPEATEATLPEDGAQNL